MDLEQLAEKVIQRLLGVWKKYKDVIEIRSATPCDFRFTSSPLLCSYARRDRVKRRPRKPLTPWPQLMEELFGDIFEMKCTEKAGIKELSQQKQHQSIGNTTPTGLLSKPNSAPCMRKPLLPYVDKVQSLMDFGQAKKQGHNPLKVSGTFFDAKQMKMMGMKTARKGPTIVPRRNLLETPPPRSDINILPYTPVTSSMLGDDPSLDASTSINVEGSLETITEYRTRVNTTVNANNKSDFESEGLTIYSDSQDGESEGPPSTSPVPIKTVNQGRPRGAKYPRTAAMLCIENLSAANLALRQLGPTPSTDEEEESSPCYLSDESYQTENGSDAETNPVSTQEDTSMPAISHQSGTEITQTERPIESPKSTSFAKSDSLQSAMVEPSIQDNVDDGEEEMPGVSTHLVPLDDTEFVTQSIKPSTAASEIDQSDEDSEKATNQTGTSHEDLDQSSSSVSNDDSASGSYRETPEQASSESPLVSEITSPREGTQSSASSLPVDTETINKSGRPGAAKLPRKAHTFGTANNCQQENNANDIQSSDEVLKSHTGIKSDQQCNTDNQASEYKGDGNGEGLPPEVKLRVVAKRKNKDTQSRQARSHSAGLNECQLEQHKRAQGKLSSDENETPTKLATGEPTTSNLPDDMTLQGSTRRGTPDTTTSKSEVNDMESPSPSTLKRTDIEFTKSRGAVPLPKRPKAFRSSTKTRNSITDERTSKLVESQHVSQVAIGEHTVTNNTNQKAVLTIAEPGIKKTNQKAECGINMQSPENHSIPENLETPTTRESDRFLHEQSIVEQFPSHSAAMGKTDDACPKSRDASPLAGIEIERTRPKATMSSRKTKHSITADANANKATESRQIRLPKEQPLNCKSPINVRQYQGSKAKLDTEHFPPKLNVNEPVRYESDRSNDKATPESSQIDVASKQKSVRKTEAASAIKIIDSQIERLNGKKNEIIQVMLTDTKRQDIMVWLTDNESLRNSSSDEERYINSEENGKKFSHTYIQSRKKLTKKKIDTKSKAGVPSHQSSDSDHVQQMRRERFSKSYRNASIIDERNQMAVFQRKKAVPKDLFIPRSPSPEVVIKKYEILPEIQKSTNCHNSRDDCKTKEKEQPSIINKQNKIPAIPRMDQTQFRSAHCEMVASEKQVNTTGKNQQIDFVHSEKFAQEDSPAGKKTKESSKNKSPEPNVEIMMNLYTATAGIDEFACGSPVPKTTKEVKTGSGNKEKLHSKPTKVQHSRKLKPNGSTISKHSQLNVLSDSLKKEVSRVSFLKGNIDQRSSVNKSKVISSRASAVDANLEMTKGDGGCTLTDTLTTGKEKLPTNTRYSSESNKNKKKQTQEMEQIPRGTSSRNRGESLPNNSTRIANNKEERVHRNTKSASPNDEGPRRNLVSSTPEPPSSRDNTGSMKSSVSSHQYDGGTSSSQPNPLQASRSNTTTTTRSSKILVSQESNIQIKEPTTDRRNEMKHSENVQNNKPQPTKPKQKRKKVARKSISSKKDSETNALKASMSCSGRSSLQNDGASPAQSVHSKKDVTKQLEKVSSTNQKKRKTVSRNASLSKSMLESSRSPSPENQERPVTPWYHKPIDIKPYLLPNQYTDPKVYYKNKFGWEPEVYSDDTS